MLRDYEKNEYSYSEYDAPKMLDKLLEKWLVELPESRGPEEIGRTNDPNYCKYHRIVGHPIKKCKAFRRQVLQLANEGNITLDEEDTEEYDWSFITIILENALQEEQSKISIQDEDFQAAKQLWLLKTPKSQNNFDSQVTLKISKSKLLDSQVSIDYQVARMTPKPSKWKTSKSLKDYQMNKIINFEVNSMTHKW